MSSKILHKIILETLKMMIEAEPKRRPEATGAKGPRGLAPSSSWGGRRVYDKASGEAFDVVDFQPRDPDEEVQKVKLQSRDKPGKKLSVSYDDYLSKYSRHTGQPVKTQFGSESPRIAAWAYSELKKQGGQKGQGEYTSGPPRARGAVDIDADTGEYVRTPSSRVIDQDVSRFEDEIAMDKIDLVASNQPLFDKMVVPYIDAYKKSLKDSIVKAQRAIKEYGGDMLKSGELDPDEVQWFKTTPASTIYAAIWELPNFHEHLLPSLGITPHHISTISSIVSKTGKLAVSALDDPATMDAIKNDPGFVTHLSKVDHGKFWNELRKAAEQSGKYRGQF